MSHQWFYNLSIWSSYILILFDPMYFTHREDLVLILVLVLVLVILLFFIIFISSESMLVILVLIIHHHSRSVSSYIKVILLLSERLHERDVLTMRVLPLKRHLNVGNLMNLLVIFHVRTFRSVRSN